MTEKIEYKSINTGAVIDVDTEKRIVVGYYAKFGNIDAADDITVKGAFTKTFNEWGPEGKNRIWHLYNHNEDFPIAKPYYLKEDNAGARFECRFPKTSFGNDMIVLYQEGFMTEHSFKYAPVKKEFKEIENRQIRLLTEVKMWEGSSVLWGCNEDAGFEGLKSQLARGEYLLRNGNLTDDSFKKLIETLENIQALLTAKTAAIITEQPEVKELTTEEVKQLFINNLTKS